MVFLHAGCWDRDRRVIAISEVLSPKEFRPARQHAENVKEGTMGANIYSVDYFYTTVEDTPGMGCKFLETLVHEDVNLLAFNAFPVGRDRTQLVIYPLNSTWLGDLARHEGLRLVGPHHAFMIHGDDELGALVGLHKKLCDADINVLLSGNIQTCLREPS